MTVAALSIIRYMVPAMSLLVIFATVGAARTWEKMRRTRPAPAKC